TIPILAFTASDNTAVIGYALTETALAPAVNSSAWKIIAPTSYTFASAGSKTLYAWAIDEADNISSAMSRQVVVTTSTNTANTHYISATGDDATGDGSLSKPWKSLAKACSSVTTSGHTIHINAGTYTETLPCNLAAGVSIEGEGLTSIIKSHYKTSNVGGFTSASISLVSTATGTTNGNQTLSNFKLDGDNLQGSGGILIRKRSNVKVHDLTIANFYKNGIAFSGPSIYQINPPYTYDTGNELYNTTITNCGDYPGDNVTWSGGGLIYITAQSDMLIHDNLLTENSRAQGHNGNIMNAGGRHFKNVKYYNNKSYKPDDEGADLNPSGATAISLPTGWNFHLEFWDIEGGLEIYNNEFHGGDIPIDIGGSHSYKGSYPYSVSIHGNLFTPISSSVRTSYRGKNAIVLESVVELSDILVYNNTFEYGYYGVSIYPLYSKNVSIYDNVFSHALYPLNVHSTTNVYSNLTTISFYRNLMTFMYGSSFYYGGLRISARETSIISDLNIYNNTFVTDNIVHMAGIDLTTGTYSGSTQIAGGNLKNINIKNNILTYFTNQGPIRIANNGAIDGLHIENNLAYNLSNANVLPFFLPANIGTMINYSYSNNIPTSNTTQQNPLFVSASNFQLQATSPAINKGVNVGLPYSGSAPDMGAFESNYAADTSKPSILNFNIPNTSSMLSVLISALTATDNLGVTGFLLTESATVPLANNSSWSTIAPSVYTFATEGIKTLYAWAKDAAGNISTPMSRMITITLAPSPLNTYYISPTGNDTNQGTINSPWKTLYKACSSVTTAGSTIYVNAGTYAETKQCNLAVGVSIKGSSKDTALISSSYQAAGEGIGVIQLASPSEGTSGNQSISEITLDGGMNAKYAIAVRGRSKVIFHDIIVKDFLLQGVTFGGRVDYADAAPTVYATGNQVYNSTISNSAAFIGGGGNLQIGGQEGMLIYNNKLIQNSRTVGNNGYDIKFYNSGYNKGLKIYSNNLTKAPYDNMTFDFAVELWNESGLEIFNNTIVGSIDINNITKGAYSYGTNIHDNIIGPNSVQSQEERGIYIEYYADTVIISNNTLRNLAVPISFIPRSGNLLKNITINNNIGSNIGMSNNQFGYAILFSGASGITNYTVDGVFIYNNVFIDNLTSNTYWGIGLPVCSSAKNIHIINNIIENFESAAITASNAANINGLNISNNIMFGNGNNNNPLFTVGNPLNYTTQNNLKVDPLFISSDFHLQATSPAINAGINVGLPYNGSAPDIGAFEY
ncbi:MAG: hypothetical protein WC467_04825, partial [Patescibacteria group bacterium]